MADTLEEIYKATLTESSFNASGEATAFTTNSTTRYVVKGVNVQQEDTNISVAADMLVNDCKVADVSSSVSGSEIIGTSSTVKIKTSTFPLTFEDQYFGFLPQNKTQIDKNITAFVNTIEDTGQGNISSNGITPIGTINTDTYYAHYQPVGPNGVAVRLRFDNNSISQMHIYNSSGTEIASNTNSYAPKCFDQRRYVYWLDGQNIKQYDTHNNTTANLPWGLGSPNQSTYPKFCWAGNGWIWGTPRYNSSSAGDRPFIYNPSTQTGIDASNGNSLNSTYSSTSQPMWAVHDGDSTIVVLRIEGVTNWRKFSVDTSSGTVTDDGSITPIQMWSTNQWMDTHDNKLYYYTFNGRVAFYDPVENDFTETTLTFSNTSPGDGRGNLWVGFSTPTSSEISARTYGINPSATYRFTGIKSEA